MASEHIIKKTIWFNILLISCFYFPLVQNAYSKPMLAPTLEEAIERSEYIVVAEYSEYSKRWDKIGYFYGPLAMYKVIEILKGNNALPQIIPIQYDFQDGSPCIEPENWTFDEKLMPQKESRWILFLTSKDNEQEIWETYRGDYGRWEAIEENFNKIKINLK